MPTSASEFEQEVSARGSARDSARDPVSASDSARQASARDPDAPKVRFFTLFRFCALDQHHQFTFPRKWFTMKAM
jgi:hypothetical protein